jgi:hypothetical protein
MRGVFVERRLNRDYNGILSALCVEGDLKDSPHPRSGAAIFSAIRLLLAARRISLT